jgi:hypothetical protein
MSVIYHSDVRVKTVESADGKIAAAILSHS